MNAWQYIAEERIQEALDKGHFDNLPGKGKPLLLEDEVFVPEDLRMAYKVLKNAGFVPQELATRKEIANLLDLLEQTPDVQNKIKQMKKLKQILLQMQMQSKHHVSLDDTNPYYSTILERLGRTEAEILPKATSIQDRLPI